MTRASKLTEELTGLRFHYTSVSENLRSRASSPYWRGVKERIDEIEVELATFKARKR